MTTQEIFRRIEGRISLHTFTDSELSAARSAAVRVIHCHMLDEEIKRRKRTARRMKPAPRPGRREDDFDKAIGILIGTHDEFGRKI